MIETTEQQFEQIKKATCDCCGDNIPVQFGQISDHMKIGGYDKGQLLEAIVCIKCMEEKILPIINIQRKNSTIGYC